MEKKRVINSGWGERKGRRSDESFPKREYLSTVSKNKQWFPSLYQYT